jgi:3-hydroxyisobutyrate dehydrogenase-like beta-hydroxyacid dehydrogenase
MNAETIGFIGVGKMGSLMAERLKNAGVNVIAFDTNENAIQHCRKIGLETVASLEKLASRAHTVMLSLPSPEIVEHVVSSEGCLTQESTTKTIIDFSTIGARAAHRVSKVAKSFGKDYIDCPVSGGLKGARDGTLSVMVACPQPLFLEIEKTLRTFGNVFHVGEVAGQAQTMKLANNLLSCAAVALTSEAMVMGAKAGLDPNLMLEIINKSTGRNSATQDKFPRSVLPGTFDFGFTTGHSHKDVSLCIDEAEAMGIPMFAGSAVRQMYATTKAKFGEHSDFTSICRVIEEWANTEVREKKKISEN